MVGGGEVVASGQTVRAPLWKAAQVLGFDIWEQALALTPLWNMQQGQVRRLFGIFEYLRYSKQRTVQSEKLILIFEISVSAQQPSNIVPHGQCWIRACFMVRLFSTVGNFSCSYWPVLGSHNMMLTFFSLFTSFLLVSCVRSSVNRPPPVCFVFVENFSLTGNDDPSQNNQQLIFVLFPHF